MKWKLIKAIEEQGYKIARISANEIGITGMGMINIAIESEKDSGIGVEESEKPMSFTDVRQEGFRPYKDGKVRPYEDTDEMMEHFNRHFELIPQKYRLPIMWVKYSNDTKCLITRVSKRSVAFVLGTTVCPVDLETLLEDFTWLDGSPCGVEEE